MRSWDARGHRNVLAAHGGQVAIDQAGAQFRVAEGGRDADDLQFRALEGQGQREGVVDVVADVGVDDGELRRGPGLGRRGLREDGGEPSREKQAEPQSGPENT